MPFHAVQVRQVVLDAGHVLDPVGVGDELVPVLALPHLLGPAVVVTDIAVHIDDLLAVELEDHPQETVGARVLGAEIQDQMFLVDPFEKFGARQRLMGPGILGGIGSHLGGAERMLLAQRVPFPVLGHEDAAQVPMSGKTDAVHVVHLALVPGGGRPDSGNGGDLRVFPGEFGFDADIARGVEAEKVIIEGEVLVFLPVAAA